jgi:2,3-bisphosphoglycerate-independent phosphoglycerate mutase
MANLELMHKLHKSAPTKIVLLVMDGLGGLNIPPHEKTELESASTPNMDRLAYEGTLGQTIPILPGITPGSGPAHLAIFGYDPLSHEIGRGVLESVGIGMQVRKGDVAARGNFCTVDADGKIIDRRAGRIPDEKAIPIVERLQSITLPGVQVEVRHVREYRFAVLMRGEGLDAELEDTDPQKTGVPPLPVRARRPEASRTAELFNTWIAEARKLLSGEQAANALSLRGFSTHPHLPPFPEIYALRSACIATYPMYRGVAELAGMDILHLDGETIEEEFATAAQHWTDYDFFFIHVKKTDSRGEDGAFEAKAAVIADVDRALPALLALKPDVLAITGDHSTPAEMRSHTWHPVPFLLWAPATARRDAQTEFGETACAQGGLGTFLATDAMPLMMAHAGRLEKYGA